jgi:hypothetical protein
MLILTQLNNQCRTNHITLLSLLDLLGLKQHYYKLLTGWVLHFCFKFSITGQPFGMLTMCCRSFSSSLLSFRSIFAIPSEASQCLPRDVEMLTVEI